MPLGRRTSSLSAIFAATFLVTACSTEPDAPSEEAASQTAAAAASLGEPRTVTENLDAPWSVTFHDGTPLVSERDSARILELDDAGQAREVGVVRGVAPRGEGGLLGLAVHANHLYAYSTAQDGNRIQRFPITGTPGTLSLGDAETLLDGIPAGSTHNGGRIAFGPDGMLYATVGDAGNRAAAQDRESLSGKILRLTPSGDVPRDNPFPGSPVYSNGHRNPQGLAWAQDGTMYSSEFGQSTWDELNMIEPGGNYGWPEVEGMAGRDEFIDPVQQWQPAEASPSGIAIMDGTLYMANLRGARLHEIPLPGATQSVAHLTDEHGRLRDVTVAPDGSLWVMTNNTDGRGSPSDGDDRILRFDPAT
nr:PQQ-dependent sugar dehydrogenase [Kocuria marina]